MPLIPHEKLREGYKKGKNLVLRLFDEDEFFYTQRQFSTSISLSILIKEELIKLNLIRNHIMNKSEISEKEWDAVSESGSHIIKLTKLYADALDQIKNLGEGGYNHVVEMERKQGTKQEFNKFSDVSNENPLIKKRLKSLNNIKKACWYLDWQNSQWVTLSSIYSEKELELLANYFLQIVGYEVANELLNDKYPLSFYHELPPEVSLLRRDPLWKKCQEFYDLIKSENFEKIIILATNIFDNFSNNISYSNNSKNQTKEIWPIPKNALMNGAILSLKNAKKLLKDAQFAFKTDRYSITLTLAILSFEEFGKHFMIRKIIDNNKTITPKIWSSEFSNHRKKLNAMLEYLNSIVDEEEKNDFALQSNELTKLIKNWRYDKLNAIYLNWNYKIGQWYTFDDLNVEARKSEAELAINIIERFFTIYVNEIKNPNFLTIEELIDLVKNGKLYFECNDCNKPLKIEQEITIHNKEYPNHIVNFYYS